MKSVILIILTTILCLSGCATFHTTKDKLDLTELKRETSSNIPKVFLKVTSDINNITPPGSIFPPNIDNYKFKRELKNKITEIGLKNNIFECESKDYVGFETDNPIFHIKISGNHVSKYHPMQYISAILFLYTIPSPIDYGYSDLKVVILYENKQIAEFKMEEKFIQRGWILPIFPMLGINYEKSVADELSRRFFKIINDKKILIPKTQKKKNNEEYKKDRLSPAIIVLEPNITEEMIRTDEFSTIIKGRTSDNEGVFQVYVNDDVAALTSDGQFQKRIKLKIGKNPIKIKAVDINGNETTKEFLIIRDVIFEEDEFSDVDFALETSNNKSNAIAVVFGIEEYQYAPNVAYAYNDAEIIREYLISTFGLKRDNIYFRYNERATKGEFDKVFSENGWIAKNADENSEIYIFYAGHGVASTDDKSAFLIPNDIDPNYASTGYSLNELYQNLSKIVSKSTTIILDACFSGVSRENEMLLADSRPVSIEFKQGSIPKNLNVFNASSGNEISSGYSQKLHGLFTYFFLKGLNKNADENNDGKITLGEMEDYLKENVSSQARKMGREQNPQLHTNKRDQILLEY